MASESDWLVVGAGGRQHRAKSLQLASPPCSGQAQPAAQEPCATQQQATGSLMPGWEPVALAQGKQRGRRGRKQHERTLEQQVADLSDQVHACRREVAASSFWACLLQACKATSAHRVCTLEAEVSCPPGCSSQLQPHPTTSEPSGSSHQQPSPPNSDPSSSSQQQPLLWTACIRQLVVYGLGSMQSSLTSRYQLALVLLLMHELLPQLSGPPIVFDPAFSEADMALLKHLGMHLAEQDERCARRTAQPTFFYMPHVEGHLCDNLLAANLASDPSSTILAEAQQPDLLPQCVLLGNSFSTYEQRWDVYPSSRQGRPDNMLRLIKQGRVHETLVPQEARFPAPSAFNDASLHLFHPVSASL